MSYPRLRHCTFVGQAGTESIHMIVGAEHFDIQTTDGSGHILFQVKRYLDGRHSTADISRITGVPEDDIRALIETFASFGLLREERTGERIPAAEFVQSIQGAATMWSRQIALHRIFGLLESGQAEKEVFLGLILETYHYVSSAARHIAVAISHCSDLALRRTLSHYLVEEYDHGPLALKTLVNLGFPVERVVAAHPTVGTISLVNMLCEVGRQSTLAYVACASLVEARREDAEKGQETLQSICRLYGYAPECVQPLLSHMFADVEAGHISLLGKALEGREFVELSEAHQVVNFLHDVKHCFDQFHDQILQYYTTPTNYIPRLKTDYFSL